MRCRIETKRERNEQRENAKHDLKHKVLNFYDAKQGEQRVKQTDRIEESTRNTENESQFAANNKHLLNFLFVPLSEAQKKKKQNAKRKSNAGTVVANCLAILSIVV